MQDLDLERDSRSACLTDTSAATGLLFDVITAEIITSAVVPNLESIPHVPLEAPNTLDHLRSPHFFLSAGFGSCIRLFSGPPFT